MALRNKLIMVFALLAGLSLVCPPVGSETRTGHPVVVSESRCDIDGDGSKEIIQIVLEKGRRYRDREPWCGNGEKWEGLFTIRVIKGASVISRESLNRLLFAAEGEEMFFWTPGFTLVFRDYNGDGRIDFNLGQYGSCNGNLYRLFSIAPDGAVERLPVEDGEGFFVSGQGRRNSTEAIRAADGAVEFSYYDNSLGKTVKARYQWNGRSFERTGQRAGGK